MFCRDVFRFRYPYVIHRHFSAVISRPLSREPKMSDEEMDTTTPPEDQEERNESGESGADDNMDDGEDDNGGEEESGANGTRKIGFVEIW